MKIDKIFM